MRRISIELVPHSPAADLRRLSAGVPVDTANVPADFAPTLAWNRRLAERALDWLRARDADAYFMPIRAELDAWLGGLL